MPPAATARTITGDIWWPVNSTGAIIAAVVKVIGALRSGDLVPGCLTQPRFDADPVPDAAAAQ